jgi:cobalt-zinc-cadmium efflux system outer membrane protein
MKARFFVTALMASVISLATWPLNSLATPITRLPELLAHLDQHPELQSLRAAAAAREAAAQQAGLAPNPILTLLGEDILGSTLWVNKDFPQTTLQWEQPLLLSGQLQTRQQALEAERQTLLKQWVAHHQILTQNLVSGWINLQGAEAEYQLLQALSQVSANALKATEQRVQAGKLSPLESQRARLLDAQFRLQCEQADEARQTARQHLAGLWGGAVTDLQPGPLAPLLPPPPLDPLLAQLESHPQWAVWVAQIQERQAIVTRERAQATPDFSLTGGLRHHHQSNDWGVVLGLSMPLQISDRNQGAITAAEQGLQQSQYDLKAAQRRLRSHLQTVWGGLPALYRQIQLLEQEALPAAQSTLTGIQTGFQQGQLTLLDVLYGQQTLLTLQREHQQLVKRYHLQLVEVAALSGQPLRYHQDPQISENQTRF